MKTRIFISFAIPFNLEERNKIYRDSIHPDSSFIVSGWSVRPLELREHWEPGTRKEIERADAVVVLVGGYTRLISSVAEEIDIAMDMRKPVIGLQVDQEASAPPNLTALHPFGELESVLAKVVTHG
jgi:hypothetical protein